MEPRNLFADDRHLALCVFCGNPPTTREHTATRVLLDDPLPENLPLVASCHDCNNGVSLDEEYLACLIDCVISGSADPSKVLRKKVSNALRHSPPLAARIDAAKRSENGRLIWKPEDGRVRNVLLKLARGHIAHQFSEPRLDEPESFWVAPLESLNSYQCDDFENPPATHVWPEIGSRAFINTSKKAMDNSWDAATGWHVLQPQRYRYIIGQSGKTVIRIVLSEYLACEVIW